MRRANRVRHALLDAGITGADIARELCVTRQYIAHVINGRNRSPQVRAHIARRLGKGVDELWPPDLSSPTVVDKYTTDAAEVSS